MAEKKQPEQDAGMENMSVNSSRRSGVREDGTGNPAHEGEGRSSNESARVPDQQVPIEKTPDRDSDKDRRA